MTAGQTHEATVAASLLEHADGRAFIGDTGYDAERIRTAAAARGMRVVIPSHPTRATEHRLDKKLYRIRYRIECLFHRLKRCRRLATRYEKTGRNYLAFVPIWGLRSDLDQPALMPRNCIPGTDDTSGMLDHEKLDVYQRAIEFVACALRIAERLPRGQAPLADQLRRAAVSIPLNIAEGGGRNRESADRARFRAIARGSAMESGALLDVIRLFSVVPQEDWGPSQVSLGSRRRNAQQNVLRPPPRGRGRGRGRGRCDQARLVGKEGIMR